jgi:hypothetical protein
MKLTHPGWLAWILGLSLLFTQSRLAIGQDAVVTDPLPVLAPSSLTDREPTNAAAPGDFTIVVLPDTQFYTAASNGPLSLIFAAQTEWIISNRVSRNIAYVTMEGDISEHGSLLEDEWLRAANALYRLEDPVKTGLADGIPYGVAVGNHDLMNGGARLFNTYFGTNHFAGHRYYGGNYGSKNNSHYDLFRAGGQDFVVLSLVMAAGRNQTLMNWANAVLQSNVTRLAIVVTHSLINKSLQPTLPTWTPEGPAIFNALTNNPNLFLMLCGHRHGQGRRHEIIGPEGRAVDILLADYQATEGGNGYLRLLEFSPGSHVIRVKTFSPWTGQWSTDFDGQFTLDYPEYPGARPAHAAGRTAR